MTEKQAYLLSFKLWIWLYQNPGKRKEDSPYKDEIRYMLGKCPLCEYYHDGEYYHDKHHDNCAGCIGDFKKGCFGSVFSKWPYREDYCKSAAAYIASKIRRHCKKQGWIE